MYVWTQVFWIHTYFLGSRSQNILKAFIINASAIVKAGLLSAEIEARSNELITNTFLLLRRWSSRDWLGFVQRRIKEYCYMWYMKLATYAACATWNTCATFAACASCAACTTCAACARAIHVLHVLHVLQSTADASVGRVVLVTTAHDEKSAWFPPFDVLRPSPFLLVPFCYVFEWM